MRTSIALVLFIAVVQLSTIVAFSPLMATKVVAPTKGKAKAQAKAPAKTKVKVQAKAKAAPKKQATSKAKAAVKARSKAEVKAAAKAKADAKAKANAGLIAKRKAAEKKKADEAAAAKAKALAKAKQAAKIKAKPKTTTSATAANVANSGTDAALAITKNIKKKANTNKQPLFPGLQATAKRPESVFKKKKESASANANNVVANKEPTQLDAVNPLEFGLSVAQSEKGQEAIGILVEGGLKFVEAIIEEGKKTKVVIPRGYDSGTGEIKKPKISNIGYKELLDAGIFAGGELFGVAKSNYEKFYVGGEAKEQTKVFRNEAKIDKNTGKVLRRASENYYVNIGGQRVLINKKL